jgi:uncharacterized delta-60 repeat protein
MKGKTSFPIGNPTLSPETATEWPKKSPAPPASGRVIKPCGAVLSLVLMAVAVMPNKACAAPGDLDPTFGTNGKVTTDFSGNVDLGNAAAVQSDGKIVVVGFTRAGSNTATEDFAIVRYNPDGSLDSTFGTGGKVTTNFQQDDRAKAVAIRSDGKIIVAGSNSNVVIVAGYNSDGTRDTSIGASFGPCSGQCSLNAIAIQSDQKIVVAGRGLGAIAGTSDFLLIRFAASGGALDPSFGNSGFVQTDFFSQSDSVSSLVIQADGKIVAGGVATTDANGSTNFALARYNSNGSLDSTFGTAGKVTTDFPGQFHGIRALALQPDGKIVAAGFTFLTDSNFGLARYNPDGTLDPSFGSGGKVITDFSGTGVTDEAHAVVVQPDGRIIAGGIVQTASDGLDFALARYNSDGSLDSNFGASGKVTTTFSSADDFVNALVLQSDGKLVAVGGSGGGDFALARYSTGLAGAPSQLLNIATRMRVQTGENVLIGGFIITGTDPKRVIIRGIGPSLSSFFSGALADPTLELYQGSTLLVMNDNWRTDQQAEIEATGIPPTNDLESAIVRTLTPGSYTAILRGKNNTTGIGVVEAYDLDRAANSRLANISTRGFVDTGDNVMIGGLIIGPAGGTNATVVVRAIGPSLSNFGISGALQDPTLDLVDSNGVVIRSNNNWRDSQEAAIIATGLQPSDDRESALVQTVAPGSYTAIVRGVGGTTGVGLVEVYHLQ